jgi:DNA-binding response OmpR family regulator
VQGPVHLVLSDVVMPEGGGFALLRRVRDNAAWHRLPFVFLTSSARDAASRELGLQLGADEFLVRPIDATVLLAAIRRCLIEGRAQPT